MNRRDAAIAAARAAIRAARATQPLPAVPCAACSAPTTRGPDGDAVCPSCGLLATQASPTDNAREDHHP